MKLVIRAPNWVGDAIMAMPAVDNARAITGADHIAVVARRATAPLFTNHPEVDRIVEIDDKSSRLRGPQQAAGKVKENSYDIGIILPPSFSSALIFKLAGIRGRIGFAGDKRSMLLTRAIKPPTEPMHRARQYLHLFEKLTGQKTTFKNPRLYLSHNDISDGGEVLKKFDLSYDDACIAIAPRAVAASRRWGSDNYGQLAARLAEELKCRIILMGTQDDFEAGEEVKKHNPATITNLCGQTGLMAAAAIISFARLFVGNDSGLAHLAGAVECPLVVLSGPDNPKETSPICKKKKLIIKNLECISCVRNDCPQTGDEFMQCMKLITIDEVLDAAKGLYKA
jgi:heptosyltransferase-2